MGHLRISGWIPQGWRKRPELPVLLAMLLVAAAVWGFVELAGEVVEGATQRFDEQVVGALRDPQNPRLPRGPRWLKEAGRDVTALGGVTVLMLMTLTAAGYLTLQRKFYAMGLMLLAVFSGAIVSTVLKAWVGRPRPPTGSELAEVFTSSFPSGHSMLSAIVYLVLGTMLARLESRRLIRWYFLAVAVSLTLLIGVSRVYLGVHYPSDVLGGWTAGLGWAVLWWLIAHWLQKRGTLEPTFDGAAVEASK